MRVLVTGAAGFIGSNLAKRLFVAGHETVAVDDFSSAYWKNLVGFPGDVLTLDLFSDADALAGSPPFNVVFHQASITDTTVIDQKKMMQNNVDAFRHLLDWAVKWTAVWCGRAVVRSTGKARCR